jgi:hypothetical protein
LQSLRSLSDVCPNGLFQTVIADLIRFSFLIELTNLSVGSTRMKTRWLPGRILKSAAKSFEPIQGLFKPGEDPRSSSFETCSQVFVHCCVLITKQCTGDQTFVELLQKLKKFRRVAYEPIFTYKNGAASPCHLTSNIRVARLDDLKWLLDARGILATTEGDQRIAINNIIRAKLRVKVYLTDRSLTGSDKTNRAKRWEVLADDFQHASIEDCWSVERKLTQDLLFFANFPERLRAEFVKKGLVQQQSTTVCPITRSVLDFRDLVQAVTKARNQLPTAANDLGEENGVEFEDVLEEALAVVHGKSNYQIGHFKPLKKEGEHVGENVCWQSADGNRIQGDLSLDETYALIREINARLEAGGIQ